MTAKNGEIRVGAAFARVAAWSVLAVVAGGLVGYYPTTVLAGPEGVKAMLVGLSIALVAAICGLVPPILALPQGPPQRMQGLLAGMLLRFVLALVLLLAGLLAGFVARLPLALWAAIGYIVLLAVDTAALAGLNKRCTRKAP